MQPCKGMTSDCIKLMGCVTVNALPAQFQTHASTVQYSAVDYWTPTSTLLELGPRTRTPSAPNDLSEPAHALSAFTRHSGCSLPATR